MARKPKSSDVNVTAFEILKAVTGESAPISLKGKPTKKKDLPEKNPAAVALGRLGGLKGGKARAKSLSAKKRTEIAQKAAKARWDR
jgi:hypothetical protein